MRSRMSSAYSPSPAGQPRQPWRQKLGPENGCNATRFGFEAAFRYLNLFRVALVTWVQALLSEKLRIGPGGRPVHCRNARLNEVSSAFSLRCSERADMRDTAWPRRRQPEDHSEDRNRLAANPEARGVDGLLALRRCGQMKRWLLSIQ